MATLTNGVYYGLRDVKIARWLGENSYGPNIDVPGIKELGVTLDVQSDAQEGDDRVVARYSKVNGVTARFSNAMVNSEVLSIITGGTYSSNAGYDALIVGQNENETAPYFAIAGKVVGAEGEDLHMMIPKCKISGNLEIRAAGGAWLVPQCELQGVYEGTINGLFRMHAWTTAKNLTIPLATS